MKSYPVSYYTDEPIHSPLKVSLFTRIHEMKNTLSQLTQVAEQTTVEKKKWLDENEDLLQHVLDNVAQDDPIQFNEPDMDPDMMKLLMEYTAVLQDLVTVSQNIFQAQSAGKQKKKKLLK